MVTKLVLNSMFRHVSFSWIIETNQQLQYDIYKYETDWIADGPW